MSLRHLLAISQQSDFQPRAKLGSLHPLVWRSVRTREGGPRWQHRFYWALSAVNPNIAGSNCINSSVVFLSKYANG
jgi:hypothetical protein